MEGWFQITRAELQHICDVLGDAVDVREMTLGTSTNARMVPRLYVSQDTIDAYKALLTIINEVRAKEEPPQPPLRRSRDFQVILDDDRRVPV